MIYQFRSTDNRGEWLPWEDCSEAMFNKIKDGLRTGWRKASDFEVRALPTAQRKAQ